MGPMDGLPRTVRSTAHAGSAHASDHWSDIVCEALVGVSARPGTPGPFSGSIDHLTFGSIELSTVASGAQQVVRTSRMIARDHEEFVLANIQLDGRAEVKQQGRIARLSPGSMTFVDSAHPYELSFAGTFSQLVVKVPRAELSYRSPAEAVAVELAASGPGRLVSDFLLGLHRRQDLDPGAVAGLLPHAIGLLDTAVSWAASSTPTAASDAALQRERVHRFITRHADDPRLDADTVAAACGLSRRTLFRALAAHGETLTGLIREARVTRARHLLRAAPERPIAAVARACGFGGEAQFHRAFRRTTGLTPGAYRSASPVAAVPLPNPTAAGRRLTDSA